MREYGYIYLLSNLDTGKVKIGKTINPESRKKQLITMAGLTNYVFNSYGPFSNYSDIENKCHSKFAGNRIVGEWFSVEATEVFQFIKSIGNSCNTLDGKKYQDSDGNELSLLSFSMAWNNGVTMPCVYLSYLYLDYKHNTNEALILEYINRIDWLAEQGIQFKYLSDVRFFLISIGVIDGKDKRTKDYVEKCAKAEILLG